MPMINETVRHLRAQRVEWLNKKRSSCWVSGRAHRQMYQGFLMVEQVDPRPRCLQSLAFLKTFLSDNVSSFGARSILDQREGEREGAFQGGRAGRWAMGARGTAEMCEPLEDARVLLCGQKCLILLPMSALRSLIWLRGCTLLVAVSKTEPCLSMSNE